jgi:hypothetical protein
MATATLTNVGKNLRRDALLSISDARVTYVAVGTNNTAPAASDTALGSESFRKAMTGAVAGVSAGEADFTMYLSPQDAVGVSIAEVGFYGGASASATPGSGVLVARGLFALGHAKTANESLVVTFTLIV